MSRSGDPDLLKRISDATEKAVRDAEIYLPDDVKARLTEALKMESVVVAKQELKNILENICLAEERSAPLCQDTGIPVLYITVPYGMTWTPEMEEAVFTGIQNATEHIPLRPNLVDPLSRENTKTNTGLSMPPVHVKQGERFTITALPKGAGSENVSRIRMMNPSDKGNIPKFVVETMLEAGGRPCPPVILGVGIGGTFDVAASLAKEALLEPVDMMTDYEQEICDQVNQLGIGPMGLGGDTTCLAVKIKTAGCHTASLPVAVNIQCWAARRATVEVLL
ncbi:fumarate hydratase [Methanospirillum hungatei]|uniref:fumarate hydratase n=1 Tax=Methanospirillum hungatei TaxID=2203 RepID=UPI0026ECA338|nr:fumarate hydratase [Methanospirillum hungatei]MCA1915288.1 fumarate hydratase [Methanospirillum hungatei]